MENFHPSSISFLLLALLSFFSIPSTVLCRQTYIIQLEQPIQSLDEDSLRIWHKSFLPESADASERLLHSYSEVFSGFAAKLSEEEMENLKKKEGFLGAFPNRVLSVLTTHTPDFLGLKRGREDKSNCDNNSLTAKDVKGKMVVCEYGQMTGDKAASIKSLGAVALVLLESADLGSTIFDVRANFPTIVVNDKDGSKITTYATSTANPTSSILFNGTVYGVVPSPALAAFSSKGPSIATPSIIKPDICGPGHNILAAPALTAKYLEPYVMLKFIEKANALVAMRLMRQARDNAISSQIRGRS
ncbi:hypothetical protein Cni_G16868 [Canna indica]|uniref:Inhibitor I9 domain-containing protein n=1 Tax=Canna indica TaxID=4628 RepID=A0AAQ3QG22_9LILI|nr:hypothetical protein Cni_G16868 [Canna indica]